MKQLEKKINEDNDSLFDEKKGAIEILDQTLPFQVAKSIPKTVRSNSEWKTSKYPKVKKVTLNTIAEFNYDFKWTIHDYEMADHLYDSNMIDAHYYTNIKKAISSDNPEPLKKNDFYRFKDRELIFKLFPGFGNVTSSNLRMLLVQILQLPVGFVQARALYFPLLNRLFGRVLYVLQERAHGEDHC